MKFFSAIFLILYSNLCFSQWSRDPSQNLQILIGSVDSKMVSDGNGGAIVVGTSFTIRPHNYAQRVDKYGRIIWDSSLLGIQVAEVGIQQAQLGSQEKSPQVVSDGTGGIYVAFNAYWVVGYYTEPPEEMYTVRTYLQRIDKNGRRCFGKEGIPLLYRPPVDTTYQHIAGLVSDGATGVFVVFEDRRLLSPGKSISKWYVNRVDSLGNRLFGDGLELPIYGEVICYEDGEGGLCIISRTLHDRNQFIRINGNSEILINREIDPAVPNQVPWDPYWSDFVTHDGVATFVWGFKEEPPPIPSVLAGVQRIDKNGNKPWGELPLIFSTRNDVLTGDITLSLDDVVISWTDSRSGKEDFYLQRFDPSGNFIWPEDGLLIEHEECVYRGTAWLTPAEHKNTILVWNERRTSTIKGLFAQKIDSIGNKLWEEDDVLVTNRPDRYGITTMPDGNNGLIICWSEMVPVRGTFIQQVNRDGELGIVTDVRVVPSPNLARQVQLLQNYPNPFNSKTRIDYHLTSTEEVRLTIIDILGREVITLVNERQNAGPHRISWNGKDSKGSDLPSGTYLYQWKTNQQTITKKLILLR